MQIGQRQFQRIGVRAAERGTAEHQIDGEARDIGHHPAPQKLHRRGLHPVGLQHAGPPQLQHARAGGQRLEHGRNVVFARGIETAGLFGMHFAHQPVGADHGGLAVFVVGVTIHHQKMVANRVEPIEIAAHRAHLRRWRCVHLLIEYAVAQALGGGDFFSGFGQPHFQRARDSQNRPLFEAALQWSGLVNVDQNDCFPKPPASGQFSRGPVWISCETLLYRGGAGKLPAFVCFRRKSSANSRMAGIPATPVAIKNSL